MRPHPDAWRRHSQASLQHAGLRVGSQTPLYACWHWPAASTMRHESSRNVILQDTKESVRKRLRLGSCLPVMPLTGHALSFRKAVDLGGEPAATRRSEQEKKKKKRKRKKRKTGESKSRTASGTGRPEKLPASAASGALTSIAFSGAQSRLSNSEFSVCCSRDGENKSKDEGAAFCSCVRSVHDVASSRCVDVFSFFSFFFLFFFFLFSTGLWRPSRPLRSAASRCMVRDQRRQAFRRDAGRLVEEKRFLL